jgi:hypothetical protein
MEQEDKMITPYTLEENGVLERKNRILFDACYIILILV